MIILQPADVSVPPRPRLARQCWSCRERPPHQPCCVPRQRGPVAGASRGPDDLELLKQEVKKQVPGKTTLPSVAAATGSCGASGPGGQRSAPLDSRAGRRGRARTAGSCFPPGFGTGVSPGYSRHGQGLQPALSLFLLPVARGCPGLCTGLRGAALGKGARGDSSSGAGRASSAPSLHSPLWFLLCRWQRERTGSP